MPVHSAWCIIGNSAQAGAILFLAVKYFTRLQPVLLSTGGLMHRDTGSMSVSNPECFQFESRYLTRDFELKIAIMLKHVVLSLCHLL